MTGPLWALVSLGVFLAATAYDWAVARYVASTAKGAPLAAANWSVTTAVFSLVGILSVLKLSPWLAIPEVCGFWVGTYLSVRRNATNLPEARVVSCCLACKGRE